METSERETDRPPEEGAPAGDADAGSRRRRVRRWLAHWANTPQALPVMMLLSFADACVSPILPEIVLVPMVLGEPRKKWRFAFWASVASVLGGMVGFGIGFALWESGVDEFFYAHIPGFTPELFEQVAERYGHSAFWVTFLAGFTPLPYKVFTVAAGVCHAHVDFGVFVAASAISRTLRFYLEIWLLARYGPPVLKFVVRRLGLVIVLISLALLGLIVWYEASR